MLFTSRCFRGRSEKSVRESARILCHCNAPCLKTRCSCPLLHRSPQWPAPGPSLHVFGPFWPASARLQALRPPLWSVAQARPPSVLPVSGSPCGPRVHLLLPGAPSAAETRAAWRCRQPLHPSCCIWCAPACCTWCAPACHAWCTPSHQLSTARQSSEPSTCHVICSEPLQLVQGPLTTIPQLSVFTSKTLCYAMLCWDDYALMASSLLLLLLLVPIPANAC